MINWFKLMEQIGPYVGVAFVITWFVKVINHSIFDYYQTGVGRIGSFLLGTFAYYRKDEIEEETDPTKKISKRVNNISGYILLAILAVFIIFVAAILFSI